MGVYSEYTHSSGHTVRLVYLFTPEDRSTVTVECSDGNTCSFGMA